MTTQKDMLDKFAQGNAARSRIIERAMEDIAKRAATSSNTQDQIVGWAKVASIAQYDSEIEQQEIANLIKVAESPMFSADDRHEAARRVSIMLGLNE